jgi:hypothetical protein
MQNPILYILQKLQEKGGENALSKKWTRQTFFRGISEKGIKHLAADGGGGAKLGQEYYSQKRGCMMKNFVKILQETKYSVNNCRIREDIMFMDTYSENILSKYLFRKT